MVLEPVPRVGSPKIGQWSLWYYCRSHNQRFASPVEGAGERRRPGAMPLLKRGTEIFPREIFELSQGDAPWWVAHTRSRQERSRWHLLRGIPFFRFNGMATRRAGRTFVSYPPSSRATSSSGRAEIRHKSCGHARSDPRGSGPGAPESRASADPAAAALGRAARAARGGRAGRSRAHRARALPGLQRRRPPRARPSRRFDHHAAQGRGRRAREGHGRPPRLLGGGPKRLEKRRRLVGRGRFSQMMRSESVSDPFPAYTERGGA